MENPATWGPAEHVVSKALKDAAAARAQGVIGLSTVRQVTDALREAGLLEMRCSGCNRLSPTTLRNKGNGIYWCGRTACLPMVRELIAAAKPANDQRAQAR